MNETVTAVLTVFDARTVIAGLAFIVALQQVWSSRRHNKLSVRPLICDHTDIDSANRSFTYHLQNKGLGTAKVIAFNFHWQGEILSEQALRTRLEKLTRESDVVKISNMGESYAISKDEEVPIIELQVNSADISDKPNDRLDEILSQLITHCRINVKFESLYGESFTFETSTSAIDLDAYKPTSSDS